MKLLKPIFVSSMVIFLTACSQSLPKIGEHTALSTLTHKGVAKDAKSMQKLEGKKIKVWGYLDTHNISLEKGIIQNQPTFWETDTNSFPLKAYVDDEAGQGIWVTLLGDVTQYKKVFEKLRDVAEKPIKILVDARVKTSIHNYNASSSLGIWLEVSRVDDIEIIN